MTLAHPTRLAIGLVAATTVLALSACSAAEPSSTEPPADVRVAAGFYPLAFVAERVGGAHADVTTLAPPGVEPHDLELSPAAVREVRGADLVLSIPGFQPSVDDAIASTGTRALDPARSLDVFSLDGSKGGPLARDPHFWLNPILLSSYATDVARELGEIDPAHADTYVANARALSDDLVALDATYSAHLASCERDTILVSHEAFGYLAGAYGLTQVGLSGIDPEAEPSPARVREVRDLAVSIGATTVYVETLVDPSVVEAFAHDAGLAVATLDPVESALGTDDYLTIMARNLDALTVGLGCG